MTKFIVVMALALLVLTVLVNFKSESLAYEYPSQIDDFIKYISTPEQITHISKLIKQVSGVIEVIEGSHGPQIDGLVRDWNTSEASRSLREMHMYPEQRRRDEEFILNKGGFIIKKSDKVFKVYVEKGTFGKYSNNQPLYIPENLILTGTAGMQIKRFRPDGSYILPPNKSEVYIGLVLTQGDYHENIPPNIGFKVDDRMYRKIPIKFKNVRTISFGHYKAESDVSYKEYIIASLNDIRRQLSALTSAVNDCKAR